MTEVRGLGKSAMSSVRLGNEKAVRKGGRYGRIMGTLWRHHKREKCGRAAMGLLLDIWSWCADQKRGVVTEVAMRKLIAGDPNGRRQLRELLAAGFMEQVPEGYAPHDWKDYGTFEREESAVRDDHRDEDRFDHRHAMNSPLEIVEEEPLSRVRASPKSPSLQVPEKKEEAAACAALSHARTYVMQPSNEQRDSLSLSESKFKEARAALRMEFSQRFNAVEPLGWTQSSDAGVDVLASALIAIPDWSAALGKMLDGFFADPWCRANHFPVAHLAKYPSKYLEPRVAPSAAPQPVTMESLRDQARQRAIAGDIEGVRVANARISEMEAAGEKARRYARA